MGVVEQIGGPKRKEVIIITMCIFIDTQEACAKQGRIFSGPKEGRSRVLRRSSANCPIVEDGNYFL